MEGFAWDAEGRRYDDLAALRAYAVRVAGSVGAMMAVLMGVRDPARLAAAIDLGVAMQLSNIARDVGEDARAGRLYLPLRWLAEAGVDPELFLAAPRHSPALGRVVQRVLDTAEKHYRRARPGIARLPLGCRLGIGAASLLYAEIGREVARRGHDSVSGRAVVSGRRKIQVLGTSLVGTALPLRPLSGTVVPEGSVPGRCGDRRPPNPGEPAVIAMVEYAGTDALGHRPVRPAGTTRKRANLMEASMRDLPGIALIALGCGLLISGVMKRRARMRVAVAGRSDPAGVRRHGRDRSAHDPVRRGIGGAENLGILPLFDGARFLSPLTFGGFLFVLAAYSVWLVLATKRPARQDALPAGAPAAAGVDFRHGARIRGERIAAS